MENKQMGSKKINTLIFLVLIFPTVLFTSSCAGPEATQPSEETPVASKPPNKQTMEARLTHSAVLVATATSTPEISTECEETPPDWEPIRIFPDDTLFELAIVFSTTVELLIQNNCLDNNTLEASNYIWVPYSDLQFVIPVTGGDPASDLNTLLSESVNQLRPGMMGFNPPDRMKQAKVGRVELRIAPVGLAGEVPSAPRLTAVATTLTGELEGAGEPFVEQLNVGTIMKARLTGDGFDITPLSEEEQFVTDDTYTEWAWNIKPTKSGERDLNLTVTVKVFAEGLGERARDIPVISRTVVVEVDPVYTITSFVGTNWQWLWTALLVPIVGWGWAYFSKKRAEQKQKTE